MKDNKTSRRAKQKRILLVDNKNVLAVLSDFLRITGYAVREAKNAQGAIEVVKEELKASIDQIFQKHYRS